VTGQGFIHVMFPKNSARNLSVEEIDRYIGMQVSINNNAPLPPIEKERLERTAEFSEEAPVLEVSERSEIEFED